MSINEVSSNNLRMLHSVAHRELSQEFTPRVAEGPEEVEKLLQVDFEYVCKFYLLVM